MSRQQDDPLFRTPTGAFAVADGETRQRRRRLPATAIIGGVLVTAALMLLFATRASQGSRRAYRRLRIISIVTVVAIAAIIASPGPFPAWLKVEQGVCGLIMAGIAVLANGSHLRALFATAEQERE